MKPIYLEMNFFGPHAHSEIDFRELDEAPLFLISGDTGAGKSTIFDAMTYALFDKTTGDREAKAMRSQFAQPDQVTEVTFYFEQGNFLYKITRRPEQELFKKRGTGTTTSKSQASLAIVDTVFGLERASLATKPIEVVNEIENLLNLTAEQFKKIILLPQNDFSKFLKSDTNEKEKILKKIFGTAVFTSFSEEIRDQYLKVNQENEKHDALLQSQYNASVWSEEEFKTLEETPDNEKPNKAKVFFEEKKKQKNQVFAKAKDARQEVAEIEKIYEEALLLEQAFSRHDQTKREYQEKILDHARFYQQQKKDYAARVWAQQSKEVLHDLEELQASLHVNQEREGTYRSNTEKDKQTLERTKARELELKAQKSQIDNKIKRIEELTSQIPQAEYAEKLKREQQELEKRLHLLEISIREINKPYQEAEITFKNTQAQLMDEELLQTKKEELSHVELDFHGQLSPLADDLARCKKEQLEAEHSVQEALVKVESLKQECLKKQAIYVAKRELRQGLMIAQLQKELEDGLPCKVCGAVEHPLSHQVSEVSDEELREAMSQVDKAQEDYAASEERLTKAQKEVEAGKIKAQEKEAEYTTKKLKLEQSYQQFCQHSKEDFPKAYDDKLIRSILHKAKADLNNNIQKNKEIKSELENLSKTLENLDKERQDKQYEVAQIKTQIDATNASLSTFALLSSSHSLKSEKTKLNQEVESYSDEVQSLNKKVNELERSYAEQKAKHTERIAQIEEQKQKIQKHQQHITETLHAPDAWTSDLDTLKKWLSEDDISEISKSINNYELEAERLTEELKEQEEKLGKAKRPNLLELKNQKQDVKESYNLIQKELIGLETTCKQLELVLNRIEEVLQKQGKAAVKAHEIRKLYHAIAGKTADKLKLETFVVQHYLEKVLEYANTHFINQLSNNRYRFELAQEFADKRRDHGLDISIYDNETGSSRSSNTLSGGETFIAALSIALALSEVVQNSAQGVQIEALFVDEGFGSLDQETLQKAMTALEQIGENRLVGLISHVEEMKDSIAQQLLIEKLGDGRSRVRFYTK